MSAIKHSTPPISVPSDPLQRRAWIIYQLSCRGLSIAALAEKQNVKRQTVWKALHHSYPKMERVIAKSIGMRAKDVWPDRYVKAAKRAA